MIIRIVHGRGRLGTLGCPRGPLGLLHADGDHYAVVLVGRDKDYSGACCANDKSRH